MTHDQVFLSPRDKGRFEEDGYSVLNGFLNLEEAQTCRILINRALDPSETDLESEQIDRPTTPEISPKLRQRRAARNLRLA